MCVPPILDNRDKSLVSNSLPQMCILFPQFWCGSNDDRHIHHLPIHMLGPYLLDKFTLHIPDKGFFWGFCDVAKVVIIQKIIQPNFAIKDFVRCEGRKKTESFYIFSYLLEVKDMELAIWNLFNSKTFEFGPLFPWKILCINWNHICQVKIW